MFPETDESVPMVYDDFTYRGRNGIGCFHILPERPALEKLLLIFLNI